VTNGQLAYAGKNDNGDYEPFIYSASLQAGDVELSNEVYIITREAAEGYKAAKAAPSPVEPFPETKYVVRETSPTLGTSAISDRPAEGIGFAAASTISPPEVSHGEVMKSVAWSGVVPLQKWMTFYSKVLSRFALDNGLKLTVHMEVSPDSGVSRQKIDETRVALRELGLDDEIDME
jgi:hypothetical protein